MYPTIGVLRLFKSMNIGRKVICFGRYAITMMSGIMSTVGITKSHQMMLSKSLQEPIVGNVSFLQTN